MPRRKLFIRPVSRYARTRNGITLALLLIPVCFALWVLGKIYPRDESEETPIPTYTISQLDALESTYNVPPTRRPTIDVMATDNSTDTPLLTNPENVEGTSNANALEYANHRDDAAWYLREVKADIDPTFGQYIEGKVSQYDTVWQATVESYFNEFDAGVLWFTENAPPDEFRASHDLTYLGISACSTGFWDLYNGAIANNQIIYQRGVGEIADCNHDWDQGDYMFWEVVLQHSLTWPAMSSPTFAP